MTSSIAPVVVHCVNSSGTNPVAPFSTWATASTTIQDAIDAAGSGDFVLVTNGLYSTGGHALAGDLTNRIAIDKPLSVAGINGAESTIVQGQLDPVSTNGPAAVRCAWLSHAATLIGMTLQGGATRNTGDVARAQSGGAFWAASSNESVLNCLIISNYASSSGGGTRWGTVRNCRIVGNNAGVSGGGCFSSTVINSHLKWNWAGALGGGTDSGYLYNSTVVSNSAPGTDRTIAVNSIVHYNYTSSGFELNWNFGQFSHCCTTIGIGGVGNIYADAQLIDGVHLTTTSPCLRAGNPMFATGLDIDGESWTNPPSIGCDEFWEAGLTGPMSVTVTAGLPEIAERGLMPLIGTVGGRGSRVTWDFGDGSSLTNGSYVYVSHSWTNAGDYIVTFTAFNTDHPGGVSTNLEVHVVPLIPPVLSAAGLSASTFSLSFSGQPGVQYIVEQATNLVAPVTWQSVRTVSGTGVVQVADSGATNSTSFYRVRIP